MNDTPHDVRAAFLALVMQRSEGERALMAFEMFDLTRVLMRADLRAQHPDLGEADLLVRIFERTYGGDFDEAERRHIGDRIRARAVAGSTVTRRADAPESADAGGRQASR